MGDGFTSTAASSFSELGAVLGASTERVANYTFTGTYSASPKYTPEQLSRVASFGRWWGMSSPISIIKERES